MEVSGQLHAPAQGKNSPISIGEEAGLAPELAWTL